MATLPSSRSVGKPSWSSNSSSSFSAIFTSVTFAWRDCIKLPTCPTVVAVDCINAVSTWQYRPALGRAESKTTELDSPSTRGHFAASGRVTGTGTMAVTFFVFESPRTSLSQDLATFWLSSAPHQDLRSWTLAWLRGPDERDPKVVRKAAPLTGQWRSWSSLLGKRILLCKTNQLGTPAPPLCSKREAD